MTFVDLGYRKIIHHGVEAAVIVHISEFRAVWREILEDVRRRLKSPVSLIQINDCTRDVVDRSDIRDKEVGPSVAIHVAYRQPIGGRICHIERRGLEDGISESAIAATGEQNDRSGLFKPSQA